MKQKLRKHLDIAVHIVEVITYSSAILGLFVKRNISDLRKLRKEQKEKCKKTSKKKKRQKKN